MSRFVTYMFDYIAVLGKVKDFLGVINEANKKLQVGVWMQSCLVPTSGTNLHIPLFLYYHWLIIMNLQGNPLHSSYDIKSIPVSGLENIRVVIFLTFISLAMKTLKYLLFFY